MAFYNSPIALGKGALQLTVKEAWPSLQKVMKEGGEVVMKLSQEQAARLKQDTVTFSRKVGGQASEHKPMSWLRQRFETMVFWLRKHIFKPNSLEGDFGDIAVIKKINHQGMSIEVQQNPLMMLVNILDGPAKGQAAAYIRKGEQMLSISAAGNNDFSQLPWKDKLPSFVKQHFHIKATT